MQEARGKYSGFLSDKIYSDSDENIVKNKDKDLFEKIKEAREETRFKGSRENKKTKELDVFETGRDAAYKNAINSEKIRMSKDAAKKTFDKIKSETKEAVNNVKSSAKVPIMQTFGTIKTDAQAATKDAKNSFSQASNSQKDSFIKNENMEKLAGSATGKVVTKSIKAVKRMADVAKSLVKGILIAIFPPIAIVFLIIGLIFLTVIIIVISIIGYEMSNLFIQSPINQALIWEYMSVEYKYFNKHGYLDIELDEGEYIFNDNIGDALLIYLSKFPEMKDAEEISESARQTMNDIIEQMIVVSNNDIEGKSISFHTMSAEEYIETYGLSPVEMDNYNAFKGENFRGSLINNPEAVGQAVANYAIACVGKPYSGEKRMMTGYYDCSSLVFKAYGSQGYVIPSLECQQAKYCEKYGEVVTSASDMMPGDLIFYKDPDNTECYEGIGHVGIYIGNGEMVEAAGEKQGVIRHGIYYGNAVMVARPYKTAMLSMPLDNYNYISTYYGWREWDQSFHAGMDFAVAEGTPIRAAASGTVLYSLYTSDAGNFIVIDHGNGYYSEYMHASERYVKRGDYVGRGDVIATVGSTGYSTGPHLHFGLVKSNTGYTTDARIDPAPYLGIKNPNNDS
ncbi:MAG: hypothetical protein E7242_01055 [Lachnospiraceae bacterium]|nr:hypothetical protein [Lachnospiraceae bacterium]